MKKKQIYLKMHNKYSFQEKKKNNHSYYLLKFKILLRILINIMKQVNIKGVRISRGRKIFHSQKTKCRKSEDSIDKPLQLIKESTKLLIQKSQ